MTAPWNGATWKDREPMYQNGDVILGEDLNWIKAERSNSHGNCAEFAELPNGDIAMRNSRHPLNPALVFSREEFTDLIGALKDGEFNYLIAGEDNG